MSLRSSDVNPFTLLAIIFQNYSKRISRLWTKIIDDNITRLKIGKKARKVIKCPLLPSRFIGHFPIVIKTTSSRTARVVYLERKEGKQFTSVITAKWLYALISSNAIILKELVCIPSLFQWYIFLLSYTIVITSFFLFFITEQLELWRIDIGYLYKLLRYEVSFLLVENFLLKYNKRKIGDKDVIVCSSLWCNFLVGDEQQKNPQTCHFDF